MLSKSIKIDHLIYPNHYLSKNLKSKVSLWRSYDDSSSIF